MHQTRAEASKRIPIARKGTKYVARPYGDRKNSVPVVIAVRDMLKLARTAKEVRKMIHEKLLKINGKEVRDYREAINLFNLLEADKTYILTLTPQKKFVFEETSQKERPCKVINKKVLKNGKIQLNCHDGTNVLSEDKGIKTDDTIYLDEKTKLRKHLSFERGKKCIVIRGRFLGQHAVVESADNNKVNLKMSETSIQTALEKKGVMLI